VRLVILALAAGLVACAAPAPRAPGPAPSVVAPRATAASPALGLIPPNASRITATVTRRTVWPPESLAGVQPAVRPGRTLYSLSLELSSVTPLDPEVSSVARPGTVIEAFSFEPLAAELVGTGIGAVVRLTGTTEGTRWMISDIGPRP
jgi:hypothetical protein